MTGNESERPRRVRVREQQRRETIDEIERTAFALLDSEGVAAVTLAAVGKQMGMTPPALYRYFASREALIDRLIVAAYADLAAVVVAAGGEGRSGVGRIQAVGREYRRWAVRHPLRYSMLFMARPGEASDPDEGVVAFNQAMLVLLDALDEGAPSSGEGQPDRADDSFLAWGRRVGAPDDFPPSTLRWGVRLWARLHGLVALDIAGAFADMGLDAGLLIEVEIDAAWEAIAGRS